MMTLSARSMAPELMDDPSIAFSEFAETLRHIERINHWTGAYRPTIQAIEYFVATRNHPKNIPLRILDIGSGHGDMLRCIARWAQLRGQAVELVGLDMNPWAAQAARNATPENLPVEYITADVLQYTPRENFHLIINALFLHHLTDATAAQVLRWMTTHADYGWFVNDLHRHVVAQYFIFVAVRMARLNRLVQHDAPLSVARAFTRNDWHKLFSLAQLDAVRGCVLWHWPFRWGVRYDV